MYHGDGSFVTEGRFLRKKIHKISEGGRVTMTTPLRNLYDCEYEEDIYSFGYDSCYTRWDSLYAV